MVVSIWKNTNATITKSKKKSFREGGLVLPDTGMYHKASTNIHGTGGITGPQTSGVE